MKKFLLLLSVLGSMTVLANSKEDMVEDGLMNKYSIITDGVNSVRIHEYDIDIEGKKIELKVELKGDDQKQEFEKLNKMKVREFFMEASKYTQTETGRNIPVEVRVELDKDLLPDEVLYKEIF
ncbi:hypothetical protein [uncultured Cetobacterium sp.]|uniref:hypothetical protein n=1 Tax=uncultured Cetobacterium sp. TaxID=527638 RepID=UPI00261348A1|nr:hypothetical protein [uncultured Cetobacterium sp.]